MTKKTIHGARRALRHRRNKNLEEENRKPIVKHYIPKYHLPSRYSPSFSDDSHAERVEQVSSGRRLSAFDYLRALANALPKFHYHEESLDKELDYD